jgi:hypothetical protein
MTGALLFIPPEPAADCDGREHPGQLGNNPETYFKLRM